MFLFFACHLEALDRYYRHRGQIEIAWGSLKQANGENIHSQKSMACVNERLRTGPSTTSEY